MKCQLPHVQFDQISDHKHDIYFYRQLSTKLLAQAANKNTKFMFTKTGKMLFSYFFFLLRFVDLLRVYITSRNLPNTFLLISTIFVICK